MDYLFGALIFIIQRISSALPTSLSFMPIETYTALFSSVEDNLIYALSGIGWLMPVDLILTLSISILIAEITLFGFKIGVFIGNLVRGSGA